MTHFEKVTKIDNSHEKDDSIEKNHRIEKTDQEYSVSKEMEHFGWVYKKPIDGTDIPHHLKEKYDIAKKMCQETQIIDIMKHSEEQNMLGTINEITKEEKNEKSKGKSIKRRTKKNNKQAKQTSMESVQKKL
jgi:hypothetical protein